MDYLKKTINNEEAYKKAQKNASCTNTKGDDSGKNDRRSDSRKNDQNPDSRIDNRQM